MQKAIRTVGTVVAVVWLGYAFLTMPMMNSFARTLDVAEEVHKELEANPYKVSFEIKRLKLEKLASNVLRGVDDLSRQGDIVWTSVCVCIFLAVLNSCQRSDRLPDK